MIRRSLTCSTKEGPNSVMALVLLCLMLLLVPSISTEITIPEAYEILEALADLPSIVYYQYGLNFSDQWKKCIEDGPNKCPWYGSVGNQGPCQKGEIFVYNRREALRTKGPFEPVCQPPPCPDGYSLVLPDRKCYHNYDIRLGICSVALKPIRNLFGETFCGCQDDQDAILLGSKKKDCHTLFTQGPCAGGSLFVPVDDLVNFGRGQCLPPPCAKPPNETQSVVEIRLRNGHTECFENLTITGPNVELRLKVGYRVVIPGTKHLELLSLSGWLGALNFAVSENCTENDEGKCVVPLKDKPVDTHPLTLEES